MPSTAKNYQAYYKTNVQTSDQLSLIIMLYDGVIRFMKKAIDKIDQEEVEEAHNYLVRAKEIISELVSTLKLEEGGEVANNLKELYLNNNLFLSLQLFFISILLVLLILAIIFVLIYSMFKLLFYSF